ncbi:MAG: hypothetical protein AB4060_07745 [Crocosphaera sp.]
MINDVKFPPNINKVTFPPNWKNTYALPPENCKNQSELFRYLDFVIPNLRENHGFLDIKQNIANEDKKFNFVARKQSFDMSIRFLHSRGEAFFIFAEFYQLNIDSLREFSIQCLKYAQEKTELHTLLLQRFYDFRPPISICFSIALVDELDENTREKILTTNTLKDDVGNLLWYEVRVVYELNRKKLYFYDQPQDIIDQYIAEGIWKELRKIIKKTLLPY